MNLKTLLNKMTLEEKIGQLTLTGSFNDRTVSLIKEGKIGSLLNVHGYEKIKSIQKMALEETRLGIPLMFGDDVIHGFRTIFPIPIAEACSWNIDMIEKNCHLTKLEASEAGINWIYNPMLDITHDPRWGRIMETSGEDPYYGSLVGKAKVRGIQKPLANGNIVAACAKHYLGYGAVEAGLDYNTTEFSEYRMRHLYLPPFKAAIDEGVLSVMNAFTTFSDTPVTSSKYLLRKVLRQECNFRGVLVSDWASVEQIKKHGTAKDLPEATSQALEAGIDIDMHSDTYLDHLANLARNNRKLRKLIDEAVLRVLEMKEKMGLFNNPLSPEPNGLMLSPEMHQAALHAAEQSIILFKNEKKLLPLKRSTKILIIGPFVDDKDVHLGAWAFKGKPEDVVSIKEGFENNGIKATYYPTNIEGHLDEEALKPLIDESDVILVTLGEPRSYSGENNNRQSIDLPYEQNQMVEALSKYQKPIVAIVMAGRPLSITKVNEKAESILWCWHLGVEAGNSIARIITGAVNPSAKTVVTFPKNLGQVPLYYNQYRTGRVELVHYLDGDLEPLYPFGYGLTYGSINYHEFTMDYNQKTHQLTLDVKLSNDSEVQSTEIIQAYLSTKSYKSLRPKQELCGFKRVTLDKNHMQQVQLKIDLNQFFEPGDFKDELIMDISVGSSSKDVITQELTIKEGQ